MRDVLIGYMRVSKADGSQVLDLQHDALAAAGVEPSRLYDELRALFKQERGASARPQGANAGRRSAGLSARQPIGSRSILLSRPIAMSVVPVSLIAIPLQ